jgi:hypothetical protein
VAPTVVMDRGSSLALRFGPPARLRLDVALSCPLPSHTSIEHSLPPLIHLFLLRSSLLTCCRPRPSVKKLRLNSDHLPDPSSASNDRWPMLPLPVSHMSLLPQAPHHGQPPPTLLQPGRQLLEDRIILLTLPGLEVSRPNHHNEPLSPFPSG